MSMRYSACIYIRCIWAEASMICSPCLFVDSGKCFFCLARQAVVIILSYCVLRGQIAENKQILNANIANSIRPIKGIVKVKKRLES
jgi:hypothetical protein